jgi:hypothetical protein
MFHDMPGIAWMIVCPTAWAEVIFHSGGCACALLTCAAQQLIRVALCRAMHSLLTVPSHSPAENVKYRDFFSSCGAFQPSLRTQVTTERRGNRAGDAAGAVWTGQKKEAATSVPLSSSAFPLPPDIIHVTPARNGARASLFVYHVGTIAVALSTA